jgi:hypothetical protein
MSVDQESESAKLLEGVPLLEPWVRSTAPLHDELGREVSSAHPLFGVRARAIARRMDTDDVLFALVGAAYPFVVVHLTWAGKPEETPAFPRTVFYRSREEWIERRMTPDHREWENSQEG